MQEYRSLDEFVYKEKRYPTGEELKELYEGLWHIYLQNANDEERNVALENGSIADQDEIVERITRSAARLSEKLKGNNKIIRVGVFERWGVYKIDVLVNCGRREPLHLFRQFIPNFCEGWEVEIFRASLLERVKSFFKMRKRPTS